MIKIYNVDGMMCPHCEAHVKAALEAIPGVESCAASHTEKKVTLTLTAEVTDEVIKDAVTKAGYQFMG